MTGPEFVKPLVRLRPLRGEEQVEVRFVPRLERADARQRTSLGVAVEAVVAGAQSAGELPVSPGVRLPGSGEPGEIGRFVRSPPPREERR